MGIWICPVCNEYEGIGALTDHNKHLEERARIAENRLQVIQSKLHFLVSSLPSLDNDKVLVETKLIREFWDAAEARFDADETAIDFLGKWLLTHRILCEAFDLFRSKGKPLIEKLNDLKQACDEAAHAMYPDAEFDVTPAGLFQERE